MEMNMTKEINLTDILKSNGIKDAVWALRCWDYMDWCLFICEVAESVLPIFEEQHPNDDRPRKALQAIRDYKDGKLTKQKMKDIFAVNAVNVATAIATANTDRKATAAGVEEANACAAAFAACDAVFAACDDADYATDTYSYAVDAYTYAAYATGDYGSAANRQKKWDEIEQIFIKHFGV